MVELSRRRTDDSRSFTTWHLKNSASEALNIYWIEQFILLNLFLWSSDDVKSDSRSPRTTGFNIIQTRTSVLSVCLERYFFPKNSESVRSPPGTGTYLDDISASYFCMNRSIFIICWIDSISTFVSTNVMISHKWSSFWFFCRTGIHGLPSRIPWFGPIGLGFSKWSCFDPVRDFHFLSYSGPILVLGSLTVAQTGATRVSNWTPLIYQFKILFFEFNFQKSSFSDLSETPIVSNIYM